MSPGTIAFGLAGLLIACWAVLGTWGVKRSEPYALSLILAVVLIHGLAIHLPWWLFSMVVVAPALFTVWWEWGADDIILLAGDKEINVTAGLERNRWEKRWKRIDNSSQEPPKAVSIGSIIRPSFRP